MFRLAVVCSLIGSFLENIDQSLLCPDRKETTSSLNQEMMSTFSLEVTPNDQQALRFLMETGEVIDLGDKCALLSDAFDTAKDLVVAFMKANEKATVSELRQTIGTTRRILMPILDRLDKQGVTVRSGDFRMLSRSYLRQQGA